MRPFVLRAVLSACLSIAAVMLLSAAGSMNAWAQSCEDPSCLDSDSDGVFDVVDNCPFVPNVNQTDVNQNGVGDACEVIDVDLDGIADAQDNCPVVANSDQRDSDQDGIGDACDFDSDGDGVPDVIDNCPVTPNADQADSDGNGIGDACSVDDDNDGVSDDRDVCPATTPASVVNSSGCSIVQLCPCEATWKNHGAYVSCVTNAANGFRAKGLITDTARADIASSAAVQSCGKK